MIHCLSTSESHQIFMQDQMSTYTYYGTPKNSLNWNSMLCSPELSSQIKILVPDEYKSH